MNIEDLDWQAGSRGGITPLMVKALLERGQLELLVRAARERGEWFCAQAAVRELCAAGQAERAWEVVRPFAETGWRRAVVLGADALVRSGRVEEALALVHPDAALREPGQAADEVRGWGADLKALEPYGEYAAVLAAAGRVDEAIDVLEPYTREGQLLWELVDVTEGRGRDERVLELLAPHAERVLKARVLERSGRAGEAIELFAADVAARRCRSHNALEFYAGLLARHRRVEELRALAGREASVFLGPFVTLMEELGRASEAEAVLRAGVAAADGTDPGDGSGSDTDPHSRHRSGLMRLLARQGRLDEAVEAARPTFGNLYGCGNLLEPAIRLLFDHGRPEWALELLDGCSEELAREDPAWVRSNRWWLMGECGRAREAVAEIDALPAEDADEREDTTIAFLLERDGRPEEAVALLRASTEHGAPHDLAHLLIRLGRPAEAVDGYPSLAAQREAEDRRWNRWREEPAAG
ncbi:hypothetical protein [Kitasatospora sp. NPDC097691]|uniref:hypothetical protein n=1 Tax=Kitasatospora sp. NPDC097691 TaxID=3157231 RepID=UPI00331FD482